MNERLPTALLRCRDLCLFVRPTVARGQSGGSVPDIRSVTLLRFSILCVEVCVSPAAASGLLRDPEQSELSGPSQHFTCSCDIMSPDDGPAGNSYPICIIW